MFASEGKALQLKVGMPVGPILHRLGGTENQVHDVTLARLQAMSLIHFPMIFRIFYEFNAFSHDELMMRIS